KTLWIIVKGDECLILCLESIEFLFTILPSLAQAEVTRSGNSTSASNLGKCCEKNYSSVRRHVADPVNVYPERSITKLMFKGAIILDVVSYQFRCALNHSKISKQNSQSSSTSFTGKTLIIPSFLDSNGSFGIQDLCFRQEPLEYVGVRDNDASESSKPSWGKMCTSGT
nr:hypothetical protein [Tanacetum cinerariifolium]